MNEFGVRAGTVPKTLEGEVRRQADETDEDEEGSAGLPGAGEREGGENGEGDERRGVAEEGESLHGGVKPSAVVLLKLAREAQVERLERRVPDESAEDEEEQGEHRRHPQGDSRL